MSCDIENNRCVLVTHEDGGKEFCRMHYETGEILGSFGFNAAKGDIEIARSALWKDVNKTPLQRIAELEAEIALKDKVVQVLADELATPDRLTDDEPYDPFSHDGWIEWAITKVKEQS